MATITRNLCFWLQYGGDIHRIHCVYDDYTWWHPFAQNVIDRITTSRCASSCVEFNRVLMSTLERTSEIRCSVTRREYYTGPKLNTQMLSRQILRCLVENGFGVYADCGVTHDKIKNVCQISDTYKLAFMEQTADGYGTNIVKVSYITITNHCRSPSDKIFDSELSDDKNLMTIDHTTKILSFRVKNCVRKSPRFIDNSTKDEIMGVVGGYSVNYLTTDLDEKLALTPHGTKNLSRC